MLSILLENFHITRNPHENVKLYVDLHKNQKLVKRGKYVSKNCFVDPVDVSRAFYVPNCSWLWLRVDDEEAEAYYGTGEYTEDDITIHENLELFLG